MFSSFFHISIFLILSIVISRDSNETPGILDFQVIVLDEKSCSWKDFSLILVFIMNDFTCYFCVFQLERFCLMATSRASLGLIPFCTSISAFQIKMWTLNKNTMITILIFVIVVSDQWGRCSRSQRRSWAQSVREGRRSRCWTGWDAWGV